MQPRLYAVQVGVLTAAANNLLGRAQPARVSQGISDSIRIRHPAEAYWFDAIDASIHHIAEDLELGQAMIPSNVKMLFSAMTNDPFLTHRPPYVLQTCTTLTVLSNRNVHPLSSILA